MNSDQNTNVLSMDLIASSSVASVDIDSCTDLEIAWQFAGQGTLRVGVARELYESEESFRCAVSQCDNILLHRIGLRLTELLYPDLLRHGSKSEAAESLLQETRYAQPVLVALEYCISEVWKSKGIRPSIVMGHSIGEYAAAVVAGVMSIEDCLNIVCDRGQLMHESLGCQGCMVALRASEKDVRQAIQDANAYSEASIAAINGELSLVLSGSDNAITRVLSTSKLNGVMHRRLSVNHAFHSPLTECMLSKFRSSFSSVKLHNPIVPIVSTVRGRLVREEIASVENDEKRTTASVLIKCGWMLLSIPIYLDN
jgi:acyl transferase domain-containing protein